MLFPGAKLPQRSGVGAAVLTYAYLRIIWLFKFDMFYLVFSNYHIISIMQREFEIFCKIYLKSSYCSLLGKIKFLKNII